MIGKPIAQTPRIEQRGLPPCKTWRLKCWAVEPHTPDARCGSTQSVVQQTLVGTGLSGQTAVRETASTTEDAKQVGPMRAEI